MKRELGLLLFTVMFLVCGCKDENSSAGLPEITTDTISLITESTAVTGGNVRSDGGSIVIRRGVCWSISPSPDVTSDTTVNGSGTGSFNALISGLLPDTAYYVRAYAVNSAGTAYGNEVRFDTRSIAEPPPDTVSVPQPQGGIWTRKSDLPAPSRSYAVQFTIGNKAYVGMGMNSGWTPLSDIWEWDQARDTWTKKTDFPGQAFAVTGFSIGNKGYLLTKDPNKLWEYDPSVDTWTEKSPLPGERRSGSKGFSMGSKGYIVIGNLPDQNKQTRELWEWDQATDKWTAKAAFPGSASLYAVSFTIGNKAYIGTGISQDGSDTREFWQWDQSTDSWTRMADLPGNRRTGASGFAIGNRGYIGGGYYAGAFLRDFWEWNQATNQWRKVNSLKGTGRADAAGFSIGNKGYIGIGYGPNGPVLKDFWEYEPNVPAR